MDNTHFDNSLFIAKVVSVRLEPELDELGKVLFGAGTIDVLPPAHRHGIRGVRVLVPNTIQVNSSPRGFYWLPAIGDWVVCAYLEGYPDYAVCLGALCNPTYSQPPEAALSDDQQTYQMHDLVMQHQTGSYIRFRNKNQSTQDSNGIWQEPEVMLSEIIIGHKAGDELKIDETDEGLTEFSYTHNTGTEVKIGTGGNFTVTHNDGDVLAMTAPTVGTAQFTYTHKTGAQVKINTGGDIIFTPASGKDVLIGSSSSANNLILGDLFRTYLNDTLIAALNNHIHPTGVGPSGVPTTQPFTIMPESNLSLKAYTER